MAPKHYSREWMENVQKKTQTDQEYQKKAKDLTYRSQYVVTDCPGGVDKLVDWTLEKGVLLKWTMEEKPAPSEFRTMPFDGKEYFMRVSGSYKTFGRMNRKEITPLQCIMQKIYKIEGPMPKIMALMGPINALNDLIASVPVEYEEV